MSYCYSTVLNPNHDQFQAGCNDHEACCFWFSIMQYQQFSNYLLLIGGPRVKQILITPTKKSYRRMPSVRNQSSESTDILLYMTNILHYKHLQS